jgi:endonuclease/exonuclease/phosphatase family metal-dependent hydrolase
MADPRRLVVATYNVHSCVGTDGRHDCERVGEVIRSLDADVVALQEVESLLEAHEGPTQLSRLVLASGFPRGIAGPMFHERRAPFGNAVLTRWPVRAVRRLDLSVPGREPRGALDLDLASDGVGLRVVATHFGLRSPERAEQWRRLFAQWRDATSPMIVLGDFNHWWWRDRLLQAVERRLGSTPALPTFPSRRPVLALDRIWLRPRSALVSLRVVASALARRASDHLPLRAEIALPENGCDATHDLR